MRESQHVEPWWCDAVVYQVYIRSFADGDGDGDGDIEGLRSRLPYLVDLGIDAIWVNPWYPSPMADGGYDVADYRSIAPMFGTMDEAEELIAGAHDAGLRVLLDIVPNHTSDRHAWFQAALAAGPGSPERQRYLFRRGRGRNGDLPPNDWRSVFGGAAWTRITESNGRPGEWYLHLFAPEQPDLNWNDPRTRTAFEEILRFWFDRGVDGFRIDVAHSLIKQEGLPDLGERLEQRSNVDHPHWDRDEVHDVYRGWRRVADGYDPPRIFVAEAWIVDPQRAARMARYVRPDELHTAFGFAFLEAPWRADTVRGAIVTSLAEQGAVGAPVVWVLSNHDTARHVSRYARDQSDVVGHGLDDLLGRPADLVAGSRRARAAALLMLALPGSVYMYQGEELGLPEVENLPSEVLADPIWERSGQTQRGRDGCRVPLPWSGDAPPFGFGPDGAADPWLPQPPAWHQHTVAALDPDPDSMLNLYRAALRLRRDLPALGAGALQWCEAADDVLVFARDPAFMCVVNFGSTPVELPAGARAILTSRQLTDDKVPQDTAVWLETGS
ncbi:glycoside hydrolase family 13 protein [soil metagenome]